MANKQGNYNRKQWKKEGGQQLDPISQGNIGKKVASWMRNRKRAQRKQG